MVLIQNNQLEFNTNLDSKPIFFTSVPASQPKPIVIERIGFFKQQNEINKPPSQLSNLSFSSLELAVELAHRDVCDEMSKDLIAKDHLSQFSANNRDGKHNSRKNKMTINNHNKQHFSQRNKNLSNLPARGFSPPTKEATINNKKSQSVLSNQKSRNFSPNRRPAKQILGIQQMSKEIITCFSHLSQKLATKLKMSDNLEAYDVERISSRIGDRHIRINRLLYSLSTDVAIIHSNLQCDHNMQIVNQLTQCFRNVLRILRLLLQQFIDWTQIGTLHIHDLNINFNEHSSNLILICCDLMNICGQLEVFNDRDKFEEYILTLKNLSINNQHKSSGKSKYKLKNIEANRKILISEPKKSVAQNVTFDMHYVNQRNANDKFTVCRNDDFNMDHNVDGVSEKSSDANGDGYMIRNDMHTSKLKPRIDYISRNKMIYGGFRKRRTNILKTKNYSHLREDIPTVPPSSNRSEYKFSKNESKNQRIINKHRLDGDNARLKLMKNLPKYMNRNIPQIDKSKLTFRTQVDQLNKEEPIEFDTHKRKAVEDLIERNQIHQEVNDITNSILDETLAEVAKDRRDQQINSLSYNQARNILLQKSNDPSKAYNFVPHKMSETIFNSEALPFHPDVDIIARRLREIELEKLDIRRRWRTLEYEEDFSHVDHSIETEKPMLFTKTKPKIFPEITKPIIESKLKKTSLSQPAIDNILMQRDNFKTCIHKLNYGTDDNIDTIYFNSETLLDKVSDDIFGGCLNEIASEIETINDQIIGNVCQSEIQICQ